MCWTCGDVDHRSGRRTTGSHQSKAGDLYRCLYCANAYHINCIAPGAVFHELALNCHVHKDRKLPELRPEASILNACGGTQAKSKLEAGGSSSSGSSNGSGGDAAASAAGALTHGMPQILVPRVPEKRQELASFFDDVAFRLPIDIHTEVFSKPPPYTHLNSLALPPPPLPRPSRVEPGDFCKCVAPKDDPTKGCGDYCLNRLMRLECVGTGQRGGGRASYDNCNCGAACGNRRLSGRQTARCRPKREFGKGWGLVALDGVVAGDLVLEYVGEVLNDEQITKRLHDHEEYKPNDPNFYIMELQHGWYIDARDKGNLSRFINHSCDPNCELQRINVAGLIRIGIVCIREVGPGEFLSYDYQFDTEHADKFMCMCGAKTCRGTMKGGKSLNGLPAKAKSKAQLLKEAKARLERDKAFVAKVQSDSVARLDQTDVMVPDATNADEQVAAGPRERFKDKVRSGNIALWRNIKRGGDIAKRFKL